MLVAWLGVVFAITLSPHNTSTQAGGDRAVSVARHVAKETVSLPHVSRRTKKRETDFIGNVLLFAPVGFLAVLAFPEHRKAIAVTGPLLSGCIETFQWAYLPRRTASVGDVFTNSTGHFIGMAAALALLALLHRRQQSTV